MAPFRNRSHRLALPLALLVLSLLSPDSPTPSAQAEIGSCPESSEPEEQESEELRQFAEDTAGGVVYDDSASELRLKREGGVFSSVFFSASGNPQYTCAADFDGDGWVDFIGGSSDGRHLGFYRNRTALNQESDRVANGGTIPWDDPDYVTTPLFERPGDGWIESTSGGYPDPPDTGDGGGVTGCGDFNGDGNADFIYILEEGNNGGRPFRADLFVGRGDGTFESPYQLTSDSDDDDERDVFRDLRWDGNVAVVDRNGDGRLDFLFGAADPSTDEGYVREFLNDGGTGWTGDPTRPTFAAGAYLVSGFDLGWRGVSGVAYADFTGEGVEDVVVTGIDEKPILLFAGQLGGTFDPPQSIDDSRWSGGGQILAAADFTLDGRNDLIMGTNGNGGEMFLWSNDGDDAPLSGSAEQEIDNAFGDFDTGFPFDYDNDPDGTIDLMFADGNGAGYSVFANRVESQYIECGEVVSGVLDLGDREGEEMVVSSARLSPDLDLPSETSIAFFMSNETPENWQQAAPCVDDPGDFCVSFDNPVGNEIRWKAKMCSNPSRTRTPAISGVELSYSFTLADVHYRAGVVVQDGVAYAGGFSQPGDRGHLFALDAALSTTYWDAAAGIDAMDDADRNIYTATTDGKTRLGFSVSSSGDEELRETLDAASEDQVEEIIAWARSARFGLQTPSRLGAVETSTPAVLSPPPLPLWYPHLQGEEKTLVDEFVSDHADRPTLILFGSKDGMLHAVRSVPTSISEDVNGTEAWAFVPSKVAFEMAGDMASGVTSAYPDGSPTLADVKLADGGLHTVAIVSGGNGARSVFALDVTDTVDPDSGEVSGPQPLWHVVPGGANAGQTRSKPAVVRVRVAGAERFFAVIASGFAHDDTTPPYTKGRDVVAVDIATGEVAWRFKAACPVTSDVAAFETDDDAESGAPEIDGFIDRVVFADACGYVYKLDPSSDLEGDWLDSSQTGSVDTGTSDDSGETVYALFSTEETEGALGAARPIVGTVGARPDGSGRVVLYFGTGGMSSFDPNLENAFYAVFADTGEIRNSLAGECGVGGCEKFYGGVVVTTTQALVTRAVDPPVGDDSCTFGSSKLQALDLSSLDEEFDVAIQAASVSPLYGDAGAVYLSTLSGHVTRVGTPRAPEAGGDSESGGEPSTTQEAVAGPMNLLGWRRIY